MKKIILPVIVALCLISEFGYCENSDITLNVDSISNVAGSSILRVCGTAKSKTNLWPIFVTIDHGNSSYTTSTNGNGTYCQLVARETYTGKVLVTAKGITGASVSLVSDVSK